MMMIIIYSALFTYVFPEPRKVFDIWWALNKW